jgi:hypothetical protein
MPCRLLFTLAALAVALPATAQATERIGGAGFSTRAPGGWASEKTHGGGWRGVQVISPGTTDQFAVNSVRMTFSWIPLRALRRRIGRPVPHNPRRLVRLLMRVRPGAAGSTTVTAPIGTRLAGQRAGMAIVDYVTNDGDAGYTSVRTTTIAMIRRRRVYDVQVRTDVSLTGVAATALATARASWRWR